MKKTFLSALLLATALTTGGAKAETIFEALSTAYDTNRRFRRSARICVR